MLRWFLILLGCVCFSTAVAYWQTSPQRERPRRGGTVKGDVNNYRPTRVLREPIRALTDPTLLTADESTVLANELVIGVELNGESRAYSINQLTGPQREIINDKLGGKSIAATW